MATVFVVGAGPAGLFAAKKIAEAGHEVTIFNRDIKPGGLAEYGIYPVKDKMKNGLRGQFAKIFGMPNVSYFGHVAVANNQPITMEALRELGPAATVFSVGAQGTKTLGLAGENSRGVYAAKDFVYFYNQLPPFASQDFAVGKRVAVVGMGNVMVDIVRWLLIDDPMHTVEEVIVVARRGPFEAKFDDKEFAHIQEFLDRQAFEEELHRVEERVKAVDQDVSKVTDETFACLKKFPDPGRPHPRLTFRFLSSPKAIHPGPDGRIEKLTIGDNLLVRKGEDTAAKATDKESSIEVDTMIFAIGDTVDPMVGLPPGPSGYATNPEDQERAHYEVFDPAAGKVVKGMYVVGWARKASDGLVGIARHDGETGAKYVLEYLEKAPLVRSATLEEITARIGISGVQAITKAALPYLEAAEAREMRERGLPRFKFSDNESMLRAIERERSAARVPNGAHSAAS